MAPRKPPATARLDSLEERVGKLERLTERVRRDQRETFRQIKELRAMIEGITSNVKGIIDDQTESVRGIIDGQTTDVKLAIAESETRNADKLTELARQWPAAAIIAATAALAVIADLILAALHLPHLS